MPKITITVPHGHEQADAVAKAKPAIEKTVSDFQGSGLEMEWTDSAGTFSFKSMAFTIKGTVDIGPTDVTVEIDLPFAAMMFKERAQKAITKNLTRAMES